LSEEQGLTPLANLALSILAGAARRPKPLVERLEQKLTHRFPQLTARERQVCARTIAGWTAERTASDLGIRTSSVLTYRQRAYRRLAFGSAHDFLEPLLH
jgi:FixJ family two-component response regulator